MSERTQLLAKNTPFRYSVFNNVLEEAVAFGFLHRLETSQLWRLARKSFYEQYEMILSPETDVADGLVSPDLLIDLLNFMQSQFGTRLEKRVEIVAHKMIAGQGIGLHNDSVPGWESHRLTITLNRDFQDKDGGFLVFFNSENPSDILTVVRPAHNCGVAFELKPNAYHAVSEVSAGNRFSLVFSFWAAEALSSFAQISPSATEIGVDFLRARQIDQESHSGSSLLAHLAGTADILNRWGCCRDVCLGGLFHSIYGTKSFKRNERDCPERREIRKVIGENAERLVYIFSQTDRRILTDALCNPLQPFVAGDARGSYLLVDPAELRAVVAIHLANTVEQLARISLDSDDLAADKRFFESAEMILPKAGMQDLLRACMVVTQGSP
jgi:hypothetical protein